MPRILSPEDYASRYEGFRVEADPRGALGAGLSSGADQLQSLGYGVVSSGLDALGFDGAARGMQDRRRLNDTEAYYNGRPDLEKIEDVNFGNAGEFAAYQMAKQGPLIGAIAGAQLIPGVGQAAAGLGLARLGATVPRILGGGGLRAGADFATRRAALAAGEGMGSSVLAGSAVGAGSLYNQSVDAGDPSPFSAFAAAPLYGAMESAVPSALRGAFRAPANLAGGVARRMATAGGLGALGEAGTELGQNELEMAFGPALSDEEAFSQRLNAGAIGGLVGGGLGSLGGIRRPRTVDEGRFDLTGNGNQAPAPNTPEYNLTTEMDPIQGRIDQNLGLQRTPMRDYEKQFLEAFNEPSGRFSSDPQTGIERELSAGELQQLQLGDLKAQEEATTQREQQVEQETLFEVSKALGVTQIANVNDTYDVLGGRIYGQPQVDKLVREVATLNQQLPPEQQQLNAAILGANLVSFSGKTGIPTAQKIGSAINGKIKQLQLEGVDSLERAAEILNDQVATLVAAGKNEGDVKLGQIATVYEKLTGQTPPALGGTTAAAPAAATHDAQAQRPQFQRAPAPQGQTNVSRDASPAAPTAPSVDGRSPVVSGSVVNPGRNADVIQEVGGNAGNPGAPAQQAPAVPNADVQRSAPVAEVVPAPVAQSVPPPVAEVVPADANPVDALLAKHFSGDARKSQIAKAYLAAVKIAPKGSKMKVQQAIAEQFGIKPVTVRKYGNTTELRATADTMGFSPEQIEALDLPDNTKAAPVAKVKLESRVNSNGVAELPYMGPRPDADKNAPRDSAKTEGLSAAGFESAESVEDSGFGGEDSANNRTWKQGGQGMGDTANVKDEAMANEIASLMEAQDDMRNLIEEYEQEGQTNLVESVRDQIVGLDFKLQAAITKYEAYLKDKSVRRKPSVFAKPKDVKVKQTRTTKAAPEVEAEKTTADNAADAWNEVADSMGSAFPRFEDLSAADQETFDEFGQANWTRQDVVQFAQDTGGDFESAKFGKNVDGVKEAKAKNPYTAKELLAELKDFIRADTPGRKLLVVDSIEDLLRSPDKMVRAVGAAIALENAYGVAANGRGYLIANRIQKGSGRAKFMHEVGAHLGLENLLTKAQYDKLTQQIVDWAKKDDGSLESELALNAAERVMNAGTPKEDQRAELLAYFIEEAMEAGIDPTADGKMSGPLRDWFRTLWAAFKTAARKLGLKPESLTAQDVVNLAFGAARLEINGTWHGTAASFRSFANKFIGSGEGATAYGWGTYLAERPGIAKGYLEADVRRKGNATTGPEGNLMRVDVAVDDGLTLDYDKPIGKQSSATKTKLLEFLAPYADEITDRTNKDVDELTGKDLLGTGESDLGLLSNLIMDDFIAPAETDANFEGAVSQGKFHEAASHLLRTLGLQGIKFYDARSRGSATDAISFGGKRYNRDDLRELSQKAYKSGNPDDQNKFILLGHILRNGLADVKTELEGKVTRHVERFVAIYADSAARYDVEVDPVRDRADAESEVSKTYEGKQLAWLNENEADISFEQNTKTRNLVVFDDKSIFRVGSEAAGDLQRMKFGKNASSVPKSLKPQVNLLTRTLRTGADAALNKIIFSEDLFKRASKMGLAAAMDMDRIYRERAALTGNIEREVTRIENLYNRIPESAQGTGAKSANQFLYDSTRENKWGFTPKWRGKNAGQVKVDAAIEQRYNALPKEAQAWVSAVLEHGDKMLKMKKDTLIASTNSEYDALIADAKKRGDANKVTSLEKDKAASLKQFQRLFATNEFNPYAPMRRFGDFVVIAKSKAYLGATPAERLKMESNPDEYHVSFAESRASALELERQLTEQGSFSEVSARSKEDARGDMYGGLMDAFNKLRGNIESELNNATEPKEIAALRAARETVAELYLQSLAENSARKSEMRRRGVAGEIDMLRSFSTQGRADAHFLASAKYNPQTQEAVVKMRQQAKQGGGQLEKSDAFKEIMARHTQSMRYEQGGWFDVAANASRITSIWMLATSPMYYLQNLTQPFVLSLPFMTGKHNWTDASGQLMRAYFQLGDLLKSAKLGEGFDFAKVSKDKGEQDMVLKLVDRGRIDIGMDTELGQVKLEGDSIVGKAANRGDQFLRSLSQKVEAVNRVSTALAAYRLEIKAGRTPAQALEYADEVISQTHGDYTRINAPRLFNTPGGKVALQFRKFQLIQLTLLSKLVYNSVSGGTKVEKAAARKILAYTLAHTGVLAGVVGMPGFAAAAFIINNLADLFGDDDEPYNLENELRKMLGGGDAARLVMRGAPTLAGADLSGKLGMGNALSILPYTDFDATREGFNAIATGLTLGATGGLGARVFQGLGDIKDGDYYRGLMGLAPVGVSQAMKAGVEAYQGETNRRGDVLVSADEIGTFETFAKAIGWPTSAQSERRFDRQVAYDNKESFEGKSSKLKNEYTKAVRSSDSEARRTTIEKWQRLQKSRQEAGFKPQPLSVLMKAPQEQTKRERNTAGGVQFNKQNRQFVQEQTAN